MPRRPRVTLVDVPHHIIQRGNNRIACFYCDDDYFLYLKWLEEYALETGCLIHAYVLMTNHVHLLVTPTVEGGLAKLMKKLGQRYVQYINRTYTRSGTLWEGRFKSCITKEDNYVLACYRYIELNPVRANMVEHPAEYAWSSYRVNAQSDADKLITPHASYQALGSTIEAKRNGYRALFHADLAFGLIDEIRSATNSNYALGSDVFQLQIEEALGRRASKGIIGRPKSIL